MKRHKNSLVYQLITDEPKVAAHNIHLSLVSGEPFAFMKLRTESQN